MPLRRSTASDLIDAYAGPLLPTVSMSAHQPCGELRGRQGSCRQMEPQSTAGPCVHAGRHIFCGECGCILMPYPRHTIRASVIARCPGNEVVNELAIHAEVTDRHGQKRAVTNLASEHVMLRVGREQAGAATKLVAARERELKRQHDELKDQTRLMTPVSGESEIGTRSAPY